MDRAYVSEFTRFMNQYLEQHPEVVRDQQRGWQLGWAPEVLPEAEREAELDLVPDDAYGFNWSARRPRPHRPKSITSVFMGHLKGK
ncbi:MAG: Uncharacterized protein FD187_1980 [bacterium]|nr:MAG: Uncharacterized protein FD142_1628 [bacterium]KAF0148557.1 MAG: Uncharacterized protein FD187_1980 [bacterium]KAF0167281.1 MAG: Uncharacterized protein FD158_2428 [bacterium]TXT20708.1 MAG: Uncharacterized protein FD132_1075 [bacterium]